jgi:octaprenyl-diphosphate synthase
MSVIERLTATVEQEMAQLEKVLFDEVASEVTMLQAICKHILSSGGKRLRPLLLLLSARVCDYTGQDHIRLGCALEYLHTATLLHDDVIDHADIRRGESAAHVLWGNQATILAGDYLFAKALSLAGSSEDLRVVKVFADISTCLSEAELLQIERCGDLSLSEQDYFHIIRNKTASLLGAAAKIGGMISGASQEELDALHAYGTSLGMAFQIVDDVLDYRSNQQEFGKTIGKDICEGSPTLPLILALEDCSEKERERLGSLLTDSVLRERHLDEILALIDRCGGTRRALEVAGDFARQAEASLDAFVGREHAWVLSELAQYVVRRRA